MHTEKAVECSKRTRRRAGIFAIKVLANANFARLDLAWQQGWGPVVLLGTFIILQLFFFR